MLIEGGELVVEVVVAVIEGVAEAEIAAGSMPFPANDPSRRLFAVAASSE